MLSRLLLLQVQFQLPLKLTPLSSNSTKVVSSAAKHVVQTLITVLLLLVMMLITPVNPTTLLETHGVPHGD